MPLVNHSQRELHLKLVYYGPGLGGKTTNLEYIHGHSRPENRGKLISLMAESERTLFFDLLPVDLGTFKGYTVRIHLCTVPGQIALDATRRLVLRHVDGIVFVVDSQVGRIQDNVDSIRNLEDNLVLQGDDPTRIPLVVQYNKRDLPNVHSVEELRSALRIPRGVKEVEAVAIEGRRVFETFKAITLECLKLVGDPRQQVEGRSPSILPGRRPSMYPGGKASGGDVSIPRPSKVPEIEEAEE